MNKYGKLSIKISIMSIIISLIAIVISVLKMRGIL